MQCGQNAGQVALLCHQPQEMISSVFFINNVGKKPSVKGKDDSWDLALLFHSDVTDFVHQTVSMEMRRKLAEKHKSRNQQTLQTH